MIRWTPAGTLAVLLLAGCGDARRPAARQVPRQSDSASPRTASSPDAFHRSPHGTAMPEAHGPEVNLGPMYLTAPESWVRRPPRSRLLLAEFSLPRAKGDAAAGRLTVSAVGGSVEANVARWRKQFGGEPTRESREELKVAGVPFSVIDFSGTYHAQHGGLARPVPHRNYRMRGAICRVAGQQYVIKCYGPEKTIADHADEFLAFLQSLRSIDSGSTLPGGADAERAEPRVGQGQSGGPGPTQSEPAESNRPGPDSAERRR